MQTIQITKLQARQAIEWYDYANKYDLKNTTIEKEIQRNSNIVEENGNYYYVRINDNTEYKFKIDTKDMTVDQILTINGETAYIPSLKLFLGDLTNEEQKQALENLYLGDIEKYASMRTGISMKFKKDLYQDKNGDWNLKLHTDNLVEHAGICKAMLKEITADTWGSIHYFVDRYTGEQELSTIRLHFSYEHLDGGTNGHEFGIVRWNEKTEQFEGYNYETNKYEAI